MVVNDDLVRVVVGQEAADKRRGVGVFLDAVLLEPVELLAGLAVEVLAIDDEQALMDAVVGLEECRGLEGGERLARAGRVPDVAVAAVLVDAVDDGLDGVDLVRAHHQELLLARDEDHVLADHLAERALGEEPIGEVVEVGNLGVVLGRELVDRKEPLVSVEGEVPRVCCWRSAARLLLAKYHVSVRLLTMKSWTKHRSVLVYPFYRGRSCSRRSAPSPAAG